MRKIELPKATHEALTKALSRYLKDELNLEVTGFDAVFLTDFIIGTMGPHVYNQALGDAQVLLSKKLEELGESILALEQAAPLSR